jgi:lauroyl/myristoyl acyltransferase
VTATATPPPTAAPDLDTDWRATARYLTYRGLGAAMGHMPLPLAQGAARGVARFMALRGGPALAMNERHMRRVLASECVDGVEPDQALVRRWSRRTFDSYARYWADGARLPYEVEAGVRARWRLAEGEEHLRAAFALGRGVVMALPHVGSWEWGGYWLALEGMPMTAVVERLEPPQLFEWFVAQRAAMGLTAVALGEGSSRALLRALKNGGIAGLVSDRDLVGNGVEVEFFGERTTLPGGAATLALRTGAPLLPVVVYSGPGNWHTGVVHAPVDTTRHGSLREDVARVTQGLATIFEEDIRRRPEQWHLYQPNWPSDTR